MNTQIDLTAMTAAVATAAETARAIGTDKHQGQSQFAAPLRGVLSHAQDLLDQHVAWLAANPPTAPATETPESASEPAAEAQA